MIGAHPTHRFIRRLRIVFTLAIAAVSLSQTVPAAPAVANPSGDGTIDVTAAPYQAAGDGVTNDRAAIQKAIDDASNSGGGTVVLPAGRTFLTGNVFMKNDVTLRIDGTLKQSQNPDDYTYEPVLGHRLSAPPGAREPRSWVTWYVNYPLIYAGHKKNVSVTGSGTIRMTQAPGDTPQSDDQTIHLQSVGFFKVTDFEISELTILCQNNDGPDIYWSDDGVLRDLTIDADPPGVCPHHRQNLGGPQIKNSENVKVTGNTITGIADDGILVGSVHDDPRDGTWWLSNEEKPTRNIVISNNIVKVIRPGLSTCGGPLTFIPWATTASDPSKVEISGIDVHNNQFYGDNPIRVWPSDRYHGSTTVDGVYNSHNHSPMKRMTFRDNTYTSVDQLGGAPLTEARCLGTALRLGRITDLKTEFGASSEAGFVNGGFDSNTAYWSVSHDAGSIRNDVSMLDDPDARAAAQERLKEWGPFGYTQGGDDRSAIYQGLGLENGVEYGFRAKVMTSGSPARLFAYNTCTGETVAELSVANTAPQEKEFVFRAKGDCDSYQIGIEQGRTGWAFMDSVSLTPTAEVMDSDDPRIRYTAGCWETQRTLDVFGNSYARAMSRPEGGWESPPCPGDAQGGEGPNPVVEATFTGTRASLIGLRRADYGMADIYVDGVYRKTVDLFHGNSVVDGRSATAWLDHQVLYDTGELHPGQHKITMVGKGTRNADSLGIEIALDAVLVEP